MEGNDVWFSSKWVGNNKGCFDKLAQFSLKIRLFNPNLSPFHNNCEEAK